MDWVMRCFNSFHLIRHGKPRHLPLKVKAFISSATCAIGANFTTEGNFTLHWGVGELHYRRQLHLRNKFHGAANSCAIGVPRKIIEIFWGVGASCAVGVPRRIVKFFGVWAHHTRRVHRVSKGNTSRSRQRIHHAKPRWHKKRTARKRYEDRVKPAPALFKG